MPDGPGGLTRLKPCRHGRMLFLTNDRYIGASLDLYGEYCEGESALFAQILAPGQIVAEVGANIGAHTVHLAKLVGPAGQVLAFEPQRIVFQILCANLALNEAFNVRAFQAASGAEPGALTVPFVNYAAPDSNFGGVSLVGVERGETVPVTPLDSIDLPSLRLVKIDVEGMEAGVIAGARNHILRHRPILYVENDRRANSADLIGLIAGLGYDLWWHLPHLFNPNNHAGIAHNVFGNVCSINMLCLPREQPHSVTGFRPVAGPDDWWENPAA
jgi:FkbM family methyltransferase